jgi:hypothetical protein
MLVEGSRSLRTLGFEEAKQGDCTPMQLGGRERCHPSGVTRPTEHQRIQRQKIGQRLNATNAEKTKIEKQSFSCSPPSNAEDVRR